VSIEDILRGLLGTAAALIVALITGLFSSFRRLSRIEEQALDRQNQIVDLRAAVRENRELIDEMRPLQTQVGFLWRMSETQALGALHHATQGKMDEMIDGYAAGTLSTDQLRQFIQRLTVIASGESGAPEQIPAAQMTLISAQAQLALRLEHPEVIDGAKQALRDESDKRMAAATAAEGVRAEAGNEPSDLEKVAKSETMPLPTGLDNGPPELPPPGTPGG
jgi:hypothetical protein